MQLSGGTGRRILVRTEANLVYRARSRIARATERIPVSGNKQNKTTTTKNPKRPIDFKHSRLVVPKTCDL